MKKIAWLLFIFTCCISVYAQNIKKIYAKADAYHQAGDFDKAIEAYTKVLKKDSTYWLAWVNRGSCYTALGQLDKMINDFEHALRIEPNDTFAIDRLADVYMRTGNYNKAIQYYKKNISLGYPFNYVTYGNLGSCYYFSGQSDSARKYLKLSYDLNQTYTLTLNNLGWANLDYNPNESCRYFNEAYLMDSLDVKNINNLGYSHLLCGSLDKAYEYIHKAEQLDPTNSFVYRNYGLYYLKKNDKVQACQNLQKAIKLNIIEDWGEIYVAELRAYCNEK